MECLEGRQSVLAALAARRRRFEVVLVNHSAHEKNVKEVLDAAEALGVPVKRVARQELDSLAHGATHGGVLAVCSPKPRLTTQDLLEIVDRLADPPLLLLLEGIEDARNLGFTLRTAEALGAHAVLIKKHLWDFDATEIARPASGAYERLAMVQIENVHPLRELRDRGLRLLGCIAGPRKKSVYNADLKRPIILAIGGEKRGLSGAVRAVCDGFVTIPTQVGASSLPLSHSAAIVLSEAHRQRLATATMLEQNRELGCNS